MSLAAAQAMVRRDPDDADARLALAKELLAVGSTEQARSSFEQALRLDPSLVPRHVGSAGAGASPHDHAAAVRLLDLALALTPDDPELTRPRTAVDGEHAE